MKVVLKGSMKPQKIDHLTSSKQKCQECSSSNLVLFSALYVNLISGFWTAGRTEQAIRRPHLTSLFHLLINSTYRLIQKIVKLLDNADQHEDGCFVLHKCCC